MKPIRDKKDLKGAVRNVQNGPKTAQKAKKDDFQRRQNQSERMMISKEPRAKGQGPKR